MKNFTNIATLVRTKRRAIDKLSQKALSTALGYNNAQFISNVERALCSIPLNNLSALCDALGLTEAEVTEALVNDYKADINSSLGA